MKSCMGKLYLELDYANNSPHEGLPAILATEFLDTILASSVSHHLLTSAHGTYPAVTEALFFNIDIDTILWSLEACESAYKFIIL